jgi:hypothetical protein
MLVPLLLAAAQAATPAASPTPAATPTPAAAAGPARPRSLADVARDRKLVPLKGTGADGPPPEAQGPLRVEDLQDNGAVADGKLSVFGRVRNTGRTPACHVRLFLRIFDSNGVLLSKGETTTDLKVIPPGEAVSFGGRIPVPPGVRGSQERAPDVLSEGPTRTNFSRVARVDGEILAYSEECK